MSSPLIKQPAEAGSYTIPFSGMMPEQGVISVVEGIDQVKAGRVPASADLVLTDIGYVGLNVRVKISGGTNGELYTLTATVQDIADNVYQRDVDILVIDLGPYLPPANGGYLTPQRYVERFGYEETTLLTDLNRIGRIDPEQLSRALYDADGIINGYLESRYTLPLTSVPALVETIAADIARYRLHRDTAPERVATAYKDALGQLRDIVGGKLSLGLTQGGEAVPASGGLVQHTAPGRIFSRDSLKGF